MVVARKANYTPSTSRPKMTEEPGGHRIRSHGIGNGISTGAKNNDPLHTIVFVDLLSVPFEPPLWSRSAPQSVGKKTNFTNQTYW